MVDTVEIKKEIEELWQRKMALYDGKMFDDAKWSIFYKCEERIRDLEEKLLSVALDSGEFN